MRIMGLPFDDSMFQVDELESYPTARRWFPTCISHDRSARMSRESPSLEPKMLLDPISTYLQARRGEYDRIGASRLEVLTSLVDRLQEEIRRSNRAGIVFVCTHNSRRSHLAQLWTAATAFEHGLPIETWSGGTEATRFDHRAVASLTRAGFQIESVGDHANAGYRVRFSPATEPLHCLSKTHDETPNPRVDFMAVMVCEEADRGCPHLPGATSRFAIPFEDPKLGDDTPEETRIYDERCREIAREMAWTVDMVAG
mgnify:CR=1 FL=1